MPSPTFRLPPRGALTPNNAVDPLRFYYMPLVGRVFVARINLGLRLLDGRSRRLLEIGYGSGLLLPTLAQAADEVDGIDLASDPAVVQESLARLGVTAGDLRVADVRALPFADGRYDTVVAFSILEHLRRAELEAALAEIARVLEPGGRLLVGVPAVHRAMALGFRAIGFRGIEDHHFSGAAQVLDAARPRFAVERTATLPRLAPLGWAPYNALLLRRR